MLAHVSKSITIQSKMLNLQETSAEHQEKLRLLLLVERQLHQRSDGKADDGEVHHNLHGGLIPGVSVDVDACAFVFAGPSLPEERHWGALEDHHKGVGYAEAGGQDHKAICDPFKPFNLEDPHVEGEEGELREALGCHIAGLGDIQVLKHVRCQDKLHVCTGSILLASVW